MRPLVRYAILCGALVHVTSTASALQNDTVPPVSDVSTATRDSAAIAILHPFEAEGAQQRLEGDAWGQPKNGALALGEILLINGIVWMYNEYPRGADFTQINPRSWYDNFANGWEWDDNHFDNNMFAHPFHGSLYYAAGRSNGFNFWASTSMTFLGSGFWECCGETHKPAINDWIATSMGGAAMGEAFYRMSSTILDNTATGSERVWREIGAAVFNPVRGFTRLVTGRATQVYANPEHPNDWIPDRLYNTIELGGRRVLDGGDVEADDNFTGYFGLEFEFGTPLGERRKPFDWFRFDLQLNSRDKSLVGLAELRGLLWNTDLVAGASSRLVFGTTLNFEYLNNNAQEWGGQSVTGSLFGVQSLGKGWALAGELGVDAYPLAAVSSELAFLADLPPGQVPEQRTYDFGVAAGGRLEATLLKNRRRIARAHYHVRYLNTLNGAKGELPGFGSIDAYHWLHAITLSAQYPIINAFGLGAEVVFYRRETYWENPNIEDVFQQLRGARFYVTWEVGRGLGG